jgi:hypothetical protein
MSELKDKNGKRLYRVADLLNNEERKQFSIPYLGTLARAEHVMAVYSGEKRRPKKGEWYLSGSVVEAYRAHNDLSSVYHIAELVKTKTETVISITIE